METNTKITVIDPKKVNKIDYNSKKFKNEIKRLHKAQKECLDKKNIDYEKMRNTYINI